ISARHRPRPSCCRPERGRARPASTARERQAQWHPKPRTASRQPLLAKPPPPFELPALPCRHPRRRLPPDSLEAHGPHSWMDHNRARLPGGRCVDPREMPITASRRRGAPREEQQRYRSNDHLHDLFSRRLLTWLAIARPLITALKGAPIIRPTAPKLLSATPPASPEAMGMICRRKRKTNTVASSMFNASSILIEVPNAAVCCA